VYRSGTPQQFGETHVVGSSSARSLWAVVLKSKEVSYAPIVELCNDLNRRFVLRFDLRAISA
jgi:hypothetical protein